MKRTYNLLGYLLLAVSAIAFVNASNTDVIATSPATPISWQAEEQTQSSPNRHTITLVVYHNDFDRLDKDLRESIFERINQETELNHGS
jgi:hypothetical protein